MDFAVSRGFELHTLKCARRIAAYGIAIVVLCLPMLWNRFPLMFDDVAGYMERWPTASLALGRSTVFGTLVWFARTSAFVPVVLLQALVTTFVVDRALAAYVPKRASWVLPATIAALSATSAIAFNVCKPIPDAWAAPALLALYLLAWHGESFRTWSRAALVAIVAFAGASHMATYAVLVGLTLVYAVAWLWRRRLGFAPNLALAMPAAWSGFAILMLGNLVVAGQLMPAAEGEIFLFGRMIEDGMVGDVLAEGCPRPDWQLCGYRDTMPTYAEAFVFIPDSPLRKIGGPYDPKVRAEIAAIIMQSLIHHPIDNAVRAAELIAMQFVDFGTGGVMDPLTPEVTPPSIARYVPQLLPAFEAARQQSEAVDLDAWSDWVVVPVSAVSSFALPLIAVLLWRAGRRREALMPGFLLLALLSNAAICGIVVGSNDRYQARLVWLAPLAALLAGISLSERSLH